MRRLKGIAASPGTASGPAIRVRAAPTPIPRHTIADPEAEWRRFRRALERAAEQLTDLQTHVAQRATDDASRLFQAHGLILEDPELLQTVRRAIESQHLNAEAAVSDATEMYAQMLETLDDDHLRMRAADVRDAGARVLRLLIENHTPSPAPVTDPSVLLANDLAPSDVATLDPDLVLGICTAAGGPASHTAILARAMGLPAIVGAGPDVLTIPDGTHVRLNGSSGELLIASKDNPSSDIHTTRNASPAPPSSAHGQSTRTPETEAHTPAKTRDGRRVPVLANVTSEAETERALRIGADGVGLLRTEFLFLQGRTLPTEEQQRDAYAAILEACGYRQIAIRVLDIGGDKHLTDIASPTERNPALGLRAIRFLNAHAAVRDTQLRAILQAGVGSDIRLLFPMVTVPDEVAAAHHALEACRRQLETAGLSFHRRPQVGAMIETPSAALTVDHLAPFVDFFSIGSNDLAQYTMAADRTNPRVSHLADALQPSVLRLVRIAVDAAHQGGKKVSLCGELARRPEAIPLLIGIGVDSLSMEASSIPLAKHIIRSLSRSDAQSLSDEALQLDSPIAIRDYVRSQMPFIAQLSSQD